MTVVLQQGINGVVLGSLYVLVALGLTLVYGVLVQINFAHAVGGALGWLMNAAIFAPLQKRGSELLPLIATIGVSVMMENAMLAWFGPIPYAFDSPYSNEVIRFGGTFITVQNALIIAVSVVTI